MKAKTVELHLLQSFPPSCVNRDGNNSPKDCTFGDARRARISSQCLKRAIRQGTLLKDFHTAGGGMFRGSDAYFAPTSSGLPGKNPVVTERYYLQDASFLVALEGDDRLLGELRKALVDPVWPVALGRRSCPPSEPVFVRVVADDAKAALLNEPLKLHRRHLPTRWAEDVGKYVPDLSPHRLRLVSECGKGDTAGEMRRDVPVVWPNQLTREYTVRFVREETIPKVPELLS